MTLEERIQKLRLLLGESGKESSVSVRRRSANTRSKRVHEKEIPADSVRRPKAARGL